MVRGISESKDIGSDDRVHDRTGREDPAHGDGTAVTVDGISGKNSGAVRPRRKSGNVPVQRRKRKNCAAKQAEAELKRYPGNVKTRSVQFHRSFWTAMKADPLFALSCLSPPRWGKDAAFEGRGKLPQRPIDPLAEK